MYDDASPDQYFTYDARVASFQKTTKKRASAAGGRGKALNWPHKRITPASLARAGFYYSPTPEHPDNVICFLCHKGLDGWEEGDDPLEEHLSHTQGCGWAVVAAIEAELAGWYTENPSSSEMVAARKATFAGRWPHENKRGWKCKTKQLVESGWKYTPTAESDDMATCVYCQLALDGWEPSDKPMDEHFKRAPNCPFFTLVSQAPATPAKKTTRGKSTRGSKAARLSTQSVATAASEVGSVDDLTISHDGTALTTASTMTAGGKKTRAKKPAAKGRKTKAKKEEPVEPEEASAIPDDETPIAPSPPKPKRGKKRASEAMEESTLTAADPPAPKKRATRGRASKAVDNSTVEPTDVEMSEAPAPKKAAASRKKSKSTATKTTRKASTASRISNTSLLSTTSVDLDQLNNDDEIDRQLEADLERPLTDDEDIMADSDSERFKAKVKTNQPKKVLKSTHHEMFDPRPIEIDEAAVDDEMKQLEEEMNVNEPEQLQVPKKGRKAGPRKASKQTKPKKTKAVTPPPPEVAYEEVEEPVELVQHQELEEEPQEVSVGSTDTVVHNVDTYLTKSSRDRSSQASIESATFQDAEGVPRLVSESKAAAPAKRGRPSKASLESAVAQRAGDVQIVEKEEAPAPAKRGRGRPSKASLESASVKSEIDDASVDVAPEQVAQVDGAAPPAKRGRGRPSKASVAALKPTSTLSALPAVASGDDSAPTKRGRGRPPKNAADGQGLRASVEPTATMVAKGPVAMLQINSQASQRDELASPTIPVAEDVEDDQIYEEPESPLPPRQQVPATPPKAVLRAQSAKQATVSPSPSLQSSDAENQPPSSRPSASASAKSSVKRIALAPIDATPVRLSPSKRNIIAGLRSTMPWHDVDIEAVLGTPRPGTGKENGAERLIKKGKDLTSPEKEMTVEEWVYYNASQAEKMLRTECETMVSTFEKEGTRAMNVLESLVVDGE